MPRRSAPRDAATEPRTGGIPGVLRDPPWRREGPRAHLEPRAIETIAVEAELAWSEEVRRLEREIARRYVDGRVHAIRELEQAKTSEHGGYPISLLALEDDECARELLRAIPRWYWADRHIVRALIARFGPEESEHIARVIGAELGSIAGVAELGSAHLARPMASGYRRQNLRPWIQRWLLRFPVHAAHGLVPLAFDEDVRLRKSAQAALRYLASKSHEAAIREAAAKYGEQVRADVERWLAIDPLLDVPSRPPKIPAWLDLDRLPSIATSDGEPLGREATERLLEMLMFTEPEPPYAGIALAAAACDRGSLDVFARALVEAWAGAGAKPAHAWALHAIAHVGSDASARWLVKQVESWAAESSRSKSMLALEVLGRIGSDVALMHVGRWARSGRRQWLKDGAAEVLETVAAARGLTPDELEDRTAPDLDLGADGTRVLDFGPRRFRVSFDERLAPFLLDESGQRLRAIPSARKSDDPKLVALAKSTWAALRKDAEHAATTQVARLERAMTARRRWSERDFRGFLVEHPLVGHLARRLLFATYELRDPSAAFRIAEDNTLADVDDALFELPAGARVGVVHPLELDPDALARWTAIFGDYEIVQPFAQLGRRTYRATEEELAANELARVVGLGAFTGRLFALRARGWRLEGDPFSLETIVRDVAPGLRAVLSFEPGIETQSPEMTVHSIVSLRLAGERAPTFARLDPIAFSELVADVEALRG
jgi:hypothetical protein